MPASQKRKQCAACTPFDAGATMGGASSIMTASVGRFTGRRLPALFELFQRQGEPSIVAGKAGRSIGPILKAVPGEEGQRTQHLFTDRLQLLAHFVLISPPVLMDHILEQRVHLFMEQCVLENLPGFVSRYPLTLNDSAFMQANSDSQLQRPDSAGLSLYHHAWWHVRQSSSAATTGSSETG